MPILPDYLVKEVLGAKRWIKFNGISISPVEFFKSPRQIFLEMKQNRISLFKAKK